MQKIASIIAASAVASTQAQAVPDGKCHALALSSGDEGSAYQAGALAGIVNATAAEDHAYDSVSGVSGGALNAVMLANTTKGNE